MKLKWTPAGDRNGYDSRPMRFRINRCGKNDWALIDHVDKQSEPLYGTMASLKSCAEALFAKDPRTVSSGTKVPHLRGRW